MIELAKIAMLSTLLLAGVARADEKQSPQIGVRAKATAGTWKCEGTGLGMDGKELAFGGTYTSKTDLDGIWIHNSFAGSMGAGKGAMKYKFETYATWDPGLEHWREVFLDNFGGQSIGTGEAMKGGKLETSSETIDATGKSTTKDHLDASDPKKLGFAGEVSKDGGKTWSKAYEMTCRK